MRTFISLAILFLGIVTPFFASAATISINPNLPGVEGATDLVSIVVNIYQTALLVGAFLAFGSIVYGAVTYALAEAGFAKSEARERITNAVIGLVLLAAAYLLLYTINPALTILTNPGLEKVAEITNGTSGSGNGNGNTVNECAGVPSTGCVFKPNTNNPNCTNAQKVIGKNESECQTTPNPSQCYTKIDCKPRSSACVDRKTNCKESLNGACSETAPVKAVLSCLGCSTKDGFTQNCTAKGINFGSLYTYDGNHNMCSCHFGGDGRTKGEGSHAIDFGNESLGASGITKALKDNCNIDTKCVAEGNHIHCYFGPNAKQEYGCW